jgi:arylsulfatase A-like enzyme
LQRREFLRITGGVLAASATGLAWGKKKKRPNIVFLLTDDQAWHLLGYNGNAQVKTPNFDKLAADGVIFDRHYDTTSICMPSRATHMMGQYQYRHGCSFSRGSLESAKWNQSYPVLMRQAGYFTGFAGKFGYAVTDKPDKSGYHSNEKMPMDSFDVWHGWPGQGEYETEENEHIAMYAEQYPHVSGALGAASEDFIDTAMEQDKPFCLSVSFKAPHSPRSPDSRYDHVYADTVWDERKNHGTKNAEHLPQQAKSGRQYLQYKDFRGERYQDTMRKYNQLVYGVDVAVKMIRDKLEARGIADNTVIIFTTDNGYSCGAHGFGGKVLPYEEASRAPMVILDPRHRNSGKGYRCQGVTGSVDIMPTIMDYAELEIPKSVDGISMRSMVENPKHKLREALPIMNVWGIIPTHELGVVTERYKYINWFFAGEGMQAAEELYDLKEDTLEMHNLVDKPEMQKTLRQMQKYYDQEVERWKKNCVQRNNYPEWAVLMDRHVSWDEKIRLIPKKEFKKYREALAKSKLSIKKSRKKK